MTTSATTVRHPEPHLRARAAGAAAAAPIRVTVTEGTADRVPVDDGSGDAGVASSVSVFGARCTAARRATAEEIETTPFTIGHIRRSSFPPSATTTLTPPHALGVAHRTDLAR